MNERGTIQLPSGTVRAVRRADLWSFVVSLMLLAQLALAAHGLNHRVHPEAARLGGNCALCQFTSNMAPAPEPDILAPPRLSVGEYIAAAEQTPPRQSRSTSGFRSPAPPPSV